MPEIICQDCGKRLFHENETTLKIEEAVHKKFCRKKEGETQSFMHKDSLHQETFDPERENDMSGKPILKK
jgi:hypothetical protein